jgi:hypothetical protein
MPTTRRPRGKAAATATEEAGGCRVPGCPRGTEWRGLCAAHRQTHRGLAAPKPEKTQEEATPGD